MATTKRNAMLHEEARNKIRTTQLINRLTNHVDGKVEMVATQVTAALGLLRKTLPDLTATELSGETIQRIASAEPLTEDEWENRYGDRVAPTNGSAKSTH
jgi:hypothetical protein